MSDEFFVEGRYFPNSLYAFTFAQIQADRMDRPVHVHTAPFEHGEIYHRNGSDWHATAHPENFRRAQVRRE